MAQTLGWTTQSHFYLLVNFALKRLEKSCRHTSLSFFLAVVSSHDSILASEMEREVSGSLLEKAFPFVNKKRVPL